LVTGGRLLLRRALAALPEGATLTVTGSADGLGPQLRAWARAEGHALESIDPAGTALVARVRRGPFVDARLAGATRAGSAGARNPDAVVERPPATWGLAPRGALVEAGGPAFDFAPLSKAEVWADEVARLYRQAAASQWDP